MSATAQEELHRLTVTLKEYVRYQQRLGLRLVEHISKPIVAEPVVKSESIPAPELTLQPASEVPPQEVITLEEVRAELGDCQRCKLWRTRTHLVFGAGDPHARLVFIGEAPGEAEDRQGEPFVGRAGQLLNRLLSKLEISRQEVYITNINKCRPPNNRTPEADEIAACRPFLWKQLQAIRPQVIVTLGAVAIHALLETKAPLNRLRGHWQQWRGIAVMPTFHPSYLLRVPQERVKTWEDMQQVLALYRPSKD
ncbi:uracil-DNA glycosylase [Desulfobacca acetoxidans]|uniref:Type-4 uracil-DNA glycosylase n=1 Tax=Desulfobacca acetoxidans (strain ATCC 700848 / DSM 11109 / ASRB2) TaxID=880072 RepID=F2NFM2_DESAR|nr:uracil-DNA glycosylase [Desulfobacca acetoxidans]AEB10141.1 phage SPO1 DNA polymerase-related protein [Desulfobacca acetoxidans DSM 11109]